MKTFVIIGIDDNREQHFTPEVKIWITSAKVFSGGARHHEIVKTFLPGDYTWINISVPLSNVFEQYKQYTDIIIFASGDPLFFGFANTLKREMPEAEIRLYPSFNSLQLLAHRLLMPYHDMHIVSLTGRSWDKLDEALIMGYDKIGVLTDNKEHTPSGIARRMLDYSYDNYTMTIGELLGNKEKEKVSSSELYEVVDKTFAYPNNLILQKKYNRPRPLGIPESEFHLLNGRTKMITKTPIRLLSLSLLDLREKAVFWDIGFCTGSVSIEAKMQFPHLKIIAFEKREEGRRLMENNARKFGTPGIEIIIDDFTNADIHKYPVPDAVFIGGHAGKLIEIMERVNNVLNPNGTIVFNSVSEDSRRLFLESLKVNKLELDQCVSVKVDDHNRIDIMKVLKK